MPNILILLNNSKFALHSSEIHIYNLFKNPKNPIIINSKNKISQKTFYFSKRKTHPENNKQNQPLHTAPSM